MGRTRVLAIDAGTGSCRAVVFTASGEQVGFAQREWHHPETPAAPGGASFDTAANWGLISTCVREALGRTGTDPAAVAAVSATSMREGIVLYDEAGEALWACPNVDGRATAEVEALVESGDASRIYETAGDWVAITSPPRLLWLAAHEPETLAAVRHVTMLSDWILQRLSGVFATDPSAGSSSGMFDLAGRTWSEWIVERCGLPASVFPAVNEPGTVVGQVTGLAAEQTGLAAGTPVVQGGADTQLALVGLGPSRPSDLIVIGGTFWQTAMTADRPLIDPEKRLRTLCHALPGQWMVEGIGFFSGLAMRWFRDAFCDREAEQAARVGADPYRLIEDLAREVPPGAGGVVATISNAMDAKRWVHASPSFLQFDLTQPARSGRRECVRAIEESAAHVVQRHREILTELSATEFDRLVMAGGAAKGELWPQIVADVTGLEVAVPVVKESSALGCALAAAVGAGLQPSLAAAGEEVGQIERTHSPDPAAHRAYADLGEAWWRAYIGAVGLAEQGIVNPLWRAPGT